MLEICTWTVGSTSYSTIVFILSLVFMHIGFVCAEARFPGGMDSLSKLFKA